MPLWLTALTVLAAWTVLATGLGLLLARHIHRSPAPIPKNATPHTASAGTGAIT
ncbi:hypothetical protein [Streptomyces sp. NPDC057939]|uniref:hypothetical protein n=1 Tax=Streptomyces sp. NPDC057939 TaxID=3346284 RepID=UPI0036E537C2